MAQPLLRTSALARAPRDTTGESWARGLTQAARGIGAGLEKRWARKEKAQNEFINSMDFDINNVSNDLFKGYATDQYKKFRDNWVTQFKDQKGLLTPEQKIMLQSDMNSLQSSIEYLNGLSEMNGVAMQKAQADPRFTYKAEDWGKVLSLMNPKDGRYDPDAIREAGSLYMQSDANIPGVSLTAMHPDDAFVEIAPNVRKLLPEEEVGSGVEQFKKGGLRYEAPYVEIANGTPKQLVDLVMGVADDPKYNVVANIDKGIANSLTPEQQKAAILEHGDKPGAFSRFYYDNMMAPEVKEEFTKPTRNYGNPKRIPPPSKGGGLFFNFGGRSSKDPYTVKGREDVVEGVPFENYYEFAKAGRSPKMVKGVTVKGVVKISAGQESPPEDATEPMDYEVIGYDGDKDVIVLRQPIPGVPGVFDTSYAPREGNEHFLKGLLDVSDIKNKKKTSTKPRFIGVPKQGF